MKEQRALGAKIIVAAFAALVILLMPASAAAQGFGVSPGSIYMTDVALGQTVERTVSINNREDTPQTFAMSVETPPAGERREGYWELPDNSWITFDQKMIEVDANSSGVVTVRVQIPDEEQWKDQSWETWVKVTGAQAGLFQVVIYVRLLISTNSELPPPATTNWGLIGGIGGTVIVLAIAGVWYWARRRRQAAHQAGA